MLSELYVTFLKDRTKPGMFSNLPCYEDRSIWETTDPGLKKHILEEAEGLLGYRWPRFQASDYMEYYSEGSRSSYDKVFKALYDPVTKLAVAECIEGEGRFLEDIANGIFARCEDTSWVHTGHLKHHGDETIPRCDGKYLDLRCASTGKQLSIVYHLLGNRLREYNPEIMDRLEKEIKERILDIYLETDQWWMNLHDGYTINNWNTHCNECVMVTALIMERDAARLRAIIEKACRSLDVFLSIYKDDGACNEGPGYWKGAAFSFIGILRLLSEVYEVDFDDLADSRIRNMGSYIYKVRVHDEWYMNYADGNGRNPMYDAPLYLAAKALRDNALTDMAVDVFIRKRKKGLYYEHFIYNLSEYIEYILTFKELTEKGIQGTKGDYYLRSAVLADANVFSARQEAGSEKGFFIGLKGGHNDESHNHNDIGCPYVYYDGSPVLVDPGAGRYTIKTFSPDRYDIWTMQSAWHSLPEINGFMQNAGIDYGSSDFKWEDNDRTALASMEISGAYPGNAGIKSYVREISLDRKTPKVRISDFIRLGKSSSDLEFYLTTMEEPVVSQPGKLLVRNKGALISIHYDSEKLTARCEKKDLSDDSKLYNSWGYEIYRINFKPSEKADEFKVDFTFAAGEENSDEK